MADSSQIGDQVPNLRVSQVDQRINKVDLRLMDTCSLLSR